MAELPDMHAQDWSHRKNKILTLHVASLSWALSIDVVVMSVSPDIDRDVPGCDA